MQNFLLLTRKALNQRHRLSHQQIDDLLNEQCAKEHLSEKHDQMFQVSEFIKLSDAFREATVPFIPLKGPILSYRLHKDACYRYSSDLDFLIPLNAVKKAIFILKKNGYQPDGFSWPDNLNKERRVIKLTNQVSFVHPKKQITIEIHWKLFKLEITDSKVLDEVLKSNGIQLRFHERKFQGFNNELELLYLIIHGGLHAWFRLKWLIDVKDFMEKIPIDTKKFTQLVLQCHASRMVSLCNAMLANYFPECPVLPCKPVRNTKKQLEFAISQIEKEDFYNRSFLEKIKIYWFTMQCFSGFRFKLSVFYSRYLNSFEFHRTS
ncbi:nucleotidyltransferase family protein [Algibacter mikhailovii]|uniref:nucleotidyltransferase family protein n=1 Tax=Algibacter mikhailovii TaxID=425498 RepID=UPI0024940F0C|nr:nucleotidyltransferase family protein [Algibacter mikhailovii]